MQLCRTRILQRLCSNRLEPEWRSPKSLRAYIGKTLKTVTDAVVLALQRKRIPKPFRAKAQGFVECAGRFQALLIKLESCPDAEIIEILEQVVSTASQLGKAAHLPDLFRNLSPQELQFQPSTHEGLTRRMAKVARYHEFSRALLHTAKNNPNVFTNAQVETVSLNKRYFKTPKAGQIATLSTCVTRCCTGDGTLTRLCQKLGVKTTQATQDFAIQVTRTANEAKVHAEIQLVTYYDLNHSSLPPRVIASNKDACYLCHKLIRIHGKYHVPGTHGRLWPEWKLLAFAMHGPLQEKLNEDLEAHIFAISRRILSLKKRPVTNLPNESTVFPLFNSASTIRSVLVPPPNPALGTGGPSESRKSEPDEMPLAVLPTDVQTGTERPARLPTPDSSAESDDPTFREPSMRTIGIAFGNDNEALLPSQPEEVTDEEVNSADNGHNEMTENASTRGDKGKGKAIDDSEEPTSSQLSTVDEDFPTGLDMPDNKQKQYTRKDTTGEPASPVLRAGPSLEPSSLQEISMTTVPKENSEEVTTSDKTKGKQKASNISPEASAYPTSSMAPSSSSPIVLSRGTTVRCRLHNDGLLPEYAAGLLTIIPGRVRHKPHAGTTSFCELHIEWLTDDEASDITGGRANVIDAQSMDGAVDVNSGSPHLVIIKHGNIMVRMSVVRF